MRGFNHLKIYRNPYSREILVQSLKALSREALIKYLEGLSWEELQQLEGELVYFKKWQGVLFVTLNDGTVIKTVIKEG